MLELRVTKRTDPNLLSRMSNHYSSPKGFVGRNICYAIYFDGLYYGHIVYGSATRFLPGRNEFFGTTISDLNFIANNVFYNISKVDGVYPTRNFTSFVLLQSIDKLIGDWFEKYGDTLVGVESLVEKPRTGDLYLRAGFSLVGQTIGYTCKRVSGQSSDNWSGKRVWVTDKNSLRPKIVLCKSLIQHRR